MTHQESHADGACACARPQLVVTVNGAFPYQAVPVTADEAPSCSSCSGAYHGSWRLGQAVGLHDPHLRGQPKKNGEPCRWDTLREPCRVHPTPEALKRQEEHRLAEQERKRQADLERQRDTEERRRNLIEILSVVCPHCSASAATLCSTPKGLTTRSLHRARRQLAGVPGPRDYVIEASDFCTQRVDEPPLDADPRAVLGDPLHDQTEAATQRRNAEEREAAGREMAAARRKLWLSTADRTAEITARPCPTCGAEAAEPCRDAIGKRRKIFHIERADAAMPVQTVSG
ncbi:zinc finger domain-containing protein [Streptomyces sp. NPDC002623]